MPKLKTHKGAAKRFKVSSTGKILRKKTSKGHLLEKKSKTRKRRLSKQAVLKKSSFKKISKLLAGGM